MKCKACGEDGKRSTTTAVILGTGRAAHGRVCRKCEKRGVLLVPMVVAPVLRVDPGAGKSAAELLAPFIKALETQQRAASLIAKDEDGFQAGRAMALAAAVHLLKEGRT
jgi:hypothetical protein